MSSPYITTILHSRVMLRPNQINNDIYLNLKKRLQERLEGKCYGDYGYISKVIKIVEKDSGTLIPENLSSSISFNVSFSCKICKPLPKTQIICQVKNINRALARLQNGPILVVVTQNRINSDIFSYDMASIRYKKKDENKYNILKENDFVKVTLKSLMFNDGDDKIVALGILEDIATEKETKQFYEDMYGEAEEKEELENVEQDFME